MYFHSQPPKYPCNSGPPTNSGSPVSLGSRDGHRACRKQPDARRDAPRPPSQSLPASRSRLPRRIAICNRQSTFPTWIPEHLIISVPAQRIVPCPAWAPTKACASHERWRQRRANPLAIPTCMFWFRVSAWTSHTLLEAKFDEQENIELILGWAIFQAGCHVGR